MNNTIDYIKNIINDYSKWDDTYEFIQTEYKEYIQENFREGTNTLEDLDVDFIIFATLNQKIIFTNYANNIEIDNKNEFENSILETVREYQNFNSLNKYKSKPLYLIKSEIQKSDETGDTKGHIIAGKFIKNSTFDNFKNIFTNVEISFINKLNENPEIVNVEHIKDINISTIIDENVNSQISFFNKNEYLFSIDTISNKNIIESGKETILYYNLIISLILFIVLFNMYNNQKKLQQKVDERTKELTKLNNELEKRVEERTLELKELNDNLELKVHQEIKKQQEQEQLLIQQSRLASMGEMIGNIAHQWRQPLNALGLVMQNIQFSYEMDELDDEFMKKSVSKVNMLTSKMSHTIDDFRNFFKPNKEKKDFNLNKLVKKTLDVIESSFEHNNITIDANHNDEIKVYGFPNEYSQAVLNVLNNAKDALIKNKTIDAKVKIKIFNDDKYGIVSIEDNAGGIDESIIEKVFDPYFTTKEEGEGTGIGLYMSKIIIEKNMHGKLNVSNKREGANFIIKIPLHKDLDS